MNAITIQLERWENAPYPIYTKSVKKETAEQLLYQVMKVDYGYTAEEIKMFTDSKEKSCEIERWKKILSKEEEAVIIECGGIYYEEMNKIKLSAIHNSVQNIKNREQQELTDAVRKFGKKTRLGYRFDFNDQGPVIAAYSNDEPTDIVVSAVLLDEYEMSEHSDPISQTRLTLLATEKNVGFIPRQYMPNEVFAGQLEYVTSDLLTQSKAS